MKYSDPFDQEEYEHYEWLKNWLNLQKHKLEQNTEKYQKERKNYDGNRKDDIQPLQELNGYCDISEEDIQKYTECMPSPYFAHIEYDEENEDGEFNEVCYIGKKRINNGSDILVYAWSDSKGGADVITQLWAGQENEKFTYRFVNPHDKSVFKTEITPLLRRQVVIEDGKYISYTNAFLSEKYLKSKKLDTAFSSGEQISDSFLLHVLEKKKNEKNISDIISTIQKNQYEVIRQPADTSFIVQGCAGSGKTMIMLHRLSFQFQRKNLDNYNVSIITPSEELNHQLYSLRNELEITDMPIFSIDEWYRNMCRYFGWTELKQKPSTSSKNLTNDFEAYIYSDRMQVDLKKIYSSLKKDCLKTKHLIAKETLRDFAIKLNLSSIYIQTDFNDSVELMHFLDKILQKNAEIAVPLQKDSKILEKQKKQISLLEQNISLQVSDLRKRILEMINYLNKRKTALKKKKMLSVYVKDIENAVEELQSLYSLSFEDYVTFETRSDPIHCILIEEKRRDEQTIMGILKDLNKGVDNKTFSKNIKKYDSEKLKLKRSYSRLINISADIDQLTAELSNLNVLSSVEVKSLEAYLNDLKHLYAQSNNIVYTFNNKISTFLSSLAQEHNSTYDDNSHYADFLRLSWAVIHGKKRPGKQLICIDEAQNLYTNEWNLIKNMNQKDLVLNLYGDIYQRIGTTETMENWNPVKNVISSNKEVFYYKFDENYRNTNQITEYTNHKINLELKMKPIGFEGENVEKITSDQFRMKLNTGSENKTAVIYKAPSKEITLSMIKQYNASEDLSFVEINKAKGLEFHTVYVFESGMTDNERYIAYTRALSQLYTIAE